MKQEEYKELLKSTGKTSLKAIKVLRDLKVPSIPECYHVAYEFCHNSHRSLDDKFKTIDGEPNENLDKVRDIYNDLVELPKQKELNNFAKRFHQLTQATTADLHTSQSEFKAYANYLREVRPLLEPDSETSILDVKMLLIKETESVRLHALEMEKKLEEAQEEIKLLESKQLEIKGLVNKDPLTGLLNRAGLKDAFGDAVLLKSNIPMAVMVADIDKFKAINDKYGHLIGDKVIKLVAKTLKENLKGIDIIARVGGEEFLILLMGSNEVNAKKVGEQLLKVIERQRIKIRKSEELIKNCTISVGISMLAEDEELTDAIDRADLAMYKAKNNGRNCVIFDA